jgi:hypothetical protein
LFDVDADAPAVTRKGRAEQAGQIVKLWTSSPTVAPILGHTHWAAYNAVSEWADHAAPVRGAKGRAGVADARALRTLTANSSAETLKRNALTLLQTL